MRTLEPIKVNVKGTKVTTQKVVWTTGLDGDPSADILAVLAMSVDDGETSFEQITKLINYAEDLKARQAARPSTKGPSDSVLNQIAMGWANEKQDAYIAASVAGTLNDGLKTFYRQMVRLNNDQPVEREMVAKLLPKCLETVE